MRATEEATRLCSFGTEPLRSWTDLYTNHTFISGINPASDIGDIVEGSIPQFALPSFIHEATHHLCLSSPVGFALAFLEYRARESITAKNFEELVGAVNDHLRAQIMIAMYRPLLEGLALFAEFDAIPLSDASQTTSETFWLAGHLFFHEFFKDLPPDAQFERIRRALTIRRAQSDFIDRKAALLSSPLDSADGHLVGYLFLKTFAVTAGVKTPIFTDTDLVLRFAISYFFYDYELVRRLVTPSTRNSDELSDLEMYLTKRLNSIFEIRDLAAMGATYERSVANGIPYFAGGPRDYPLGAPDNDPETREQVIGILDQLIKELPKRTRDQFLRRNIMHLTSIPSRLLVEGNRFTAFRDYGDQRFDPSQPDFKQKLVDGTIEEPWRGERVAVGSTDVFVDIARMVGGVAVSVDGRVIWHVELGATDNKMKEEAKQLFGYLVLDRQTIVREADAATAAFERMVAVQGWADGRKLILDSTRKKTQYLYERIAFFWLSKEKQDEFLKTLTPRGFRGFLGPEWIKIFATITMLDGMGAYLEEVSFADGSSLAAFCDAILYDFITRIGISPMVLEAAERDGQPRTRVRVFA